MTEPATITRAGLERIDELEPLWAALQEHHAALAPTLGGLRARSVEESWAARRPKYERALQDPDAFVMVAERRERPVGYAFVSLGEGPSGWEHGSRVADVETVSVLTDARGQGVGAALMDAVESELARLDVREFRVKILPSNVDALRFYERRGLTPVTETFLGRVRSKDDEPE